MDFYFQGQQILLDYSLHIVSPVSKFFVTRQCGDIRGWLAGERGSGSGISGLEIPAGRPQRKSKLAYRHRMQGDQGESYRGSFVWIQSRKVHCYLSKARWRCGLFSLVFTGGNLPLSHHSAFLRWLRLKGHFLVLFCVCLEG